MDMIDSLSEPTDAELADEETKRRRVIFALVGGFLAVLVGIVAVQWAVDSGDAQDSDADEGDPLPVAALTTLEGDPFPLESIVGAPTVLNFFASWCGPCRAELPSFQEVSQARKGKVKFVGINTRETDIDNALELVAETGVTYTVALGDDGTLFQDVGGLGMPATAFVSAEGRIVEVHSGILTQGDLENKIDEHFG